MRQLLLFMMVLYATVGCSNTRWIIRDEPKVDPNDYDVVSSRSYIDRAGTLAPTNPVLTLQLKEIVSYNYARKIVTERHVQDFRPKWGYSILAITGSAIAIGIANHPRLKDDYSQFQSITFSAVGGALALSTALNLKPVGDPQPTGEVEYLRRVGTVNRVDTTFARSGAESSVALTLRLGDQVLVDKRMFSFKDNRLPINILQFIDENTFNSFDPGLLTLTVDHTTDSYSFAIPVSNVLSPYFLVDGSNAAVYTEPTGSSSDVMAVLTNGSRLKFEGMVDSTWYRVRLGITESFVKQEEGQIIWRPDELDENILLKSSTDDFGNIDVEQNLPEFDLDRISYNGVVLTPFQNRNEEQAIRWRDAKLMRYYFEQAFSIPAPRLLYYDGEGAANYRRVSAHIDSLISDSPSRLLFYINGPAELVDEGTGQDMIITDPNGGSNTLALSRLLREIAISTTQPVIAILDVEYEAGSQSTGAFYNQLYEQLKTLNEGIVLLTGAKTGQLSHLYRSSETNKKHSIFTYYLAQAWKERVTRLGELERYLKSNVTYTSRKIHDEAQEPQLYGKATLDLVSDR